MRQTLPFQEVILVDDASTDDSLEVVQSFAGRLPSLRVLSLPERKGVSVARDAGIRAASSMFISTLDSDDFFWSERKHEAEWRLVQSSRDPEMTAAFSDIRRVDRAGGDLGSVGAKKGIREGRVFWSLLFLSGMIPRDFLFSREAYFKAGGYDKGFEIYEDWDLKLRIAGFCRFLYSRETGVAYRDNPAGLSRAPLKNHYMTMSAILRKNTTALALHTKTFARCYGTLRILWFLRFKIAALVE